MTRVGDWMPTYTGGEFWPLDPRPEDVEIVDIARALSRICRYGGHTGPFFSVAEHSVLVARHASKENRLAALLHDAPEYVLGDKIRPLKPYLNGYQAIEDGVYRAIAERFGLPGTIPDEVKRLDEAIRADEKAQAMGHQERDWCLPYPSGLGVRLEFWDQDRAMDEFLLAFEIYGGK